MRIRPIIHLLRVVVALSASAAAAQDHDMMEQHTHEHGHWRMFAAIDGDLLTLSFSGPAIDVLGFEHVPQTKEERDAVRALAEAFSEQETVSLTPAANCKLAAPAETIFSEGFEVNIPRENEPHSSHHAEEKEHPVAEGRHEEGDHDHREAEIEVVYVYSCTSPEKIARITHRLFDRYPSIEEIDAVFLTDSKQGAQALTRSSPDLRLK